MGIGVFVLTATFAQGLGAQRGIAVRGEISSATTILGSLTVELEPDGSGPSESAAVRPDGTFEFHSAPPGMHVLRVVGSDGGTIHLERVVIGGPNQLLSIRLPEPPNASRSSENTISLRQLTHKIPLQAQKAFTKGEQAAARGDHRQAAESFRQAVTIDPEFVDAYNELGAAEAALGELPQAAEEFQKAIDLAPDHRLALPNLSIVLAKMKRFHEAGEVARRALKVVPGACPIRYILAASLLIEKGDSEEVLDNLERAAAEVPKAHLVAADLLAQRGRRQDAVRHLEEYLRVTPTGDAERVKVESRHAQLRQ
jgi:tetratricopeptide (TPR) repeat protein